MWNISMACSAARSSVGAGSSRSMLGHFDLAQRHHHQPHFRPKDGAGPGFEYVMYHEMLHLRFPVDHTGAAQGAHEEFRGGKIPELESGKNYQAALVAPGRQGGGHQVAVRCRITSKICTRAVTSTEQYPSDTGKDGNTQPAFRTRT
jgi:hypothetical protein